MPLTSRSRSPDPERVRAVLGLDSPSASGWVPARPAGSVAELDDRYEQADRAGRADAGWCPAPGREEPALDQELERLDEDLRRARRPGLLTMPRQLKSARVDVSGQAVLAVLALLIAVACLFAIRVLWAERSGSDVIAPAKGEGSAHAATTSQPGAVVSSPTQRMGSMNPTNSASAQAATAAPIVVHVVGQVAKPGLVRLRPGSRVSDAITAAGGSTGAADLGSLNLARVVTDGEQILVPRPGQVVSPAPGGAPGGRDGPVNPGGSQSGGMVDLNTADAAALDGLPGVGPVLAQRIIDWRSEHGRFTSVDELVEVPGIGDKLLSQLKPKVRV